MARLITFIALIGFVAVNAKPTPGELPSVMLGVFENDFAKEHNYKEFVSVLGLPEILFQRENKIGYYKEGDKFVQRYSYWTKVTFNLPFKLNEQGTTQIGKHNFEYVFTLEEGTNNQEPILRTKFKQTDGGIQFNVEQLFKDEGIQVTYTRENIVAKRFYRRAIPAFALGAFEADVSTVSDDDVKYYNENFPLPKSVRWGNKIQFFLGKKGDHYVDKFIPNPEYMFVIPFQLNKRLETTIAGQKISYKYNLTESTPESVTIYAEIEAGGETSAYVNVFHNNGTMTTSSQNSKGSFHVTFRKTVPWVLYGRFEDIPEKAENWEKFVEGQQDQPCKYLTIDHDGQDQFVMRKELVNGHKLELPFKLNTPGKVAFPNGKTIKYNFLTDYVEETALLATHNEISGENVKFYVEIVPPTRKIPYVQVIYKRGDVIATRFYRRVISPLVFGKFESNEESEEYKKFSAASGAPNIVSIEISQNADGKLVKKGTTNDGKTLESVMELGKAQEVSVFGKTFEVFYYAYGPQNKQHLAGLYKEVNGPANFGVVDRFAPDSMTVTMIYGGNVTVYGENVVTRVYNRVGAPVNV